MDKYEKIYKELRKEYSDEEIAESMLIPQDLTLEEQEKNRVELLAFRLKLLREGGEEARIYSDLLRFKYLMENYTEGIFFDKNKTFGKHLEEYARILKRTKKKLSDDLGIHYTRLSRIINDREEPNIGLMYRLEKHSGGVVPALCWWKLVVKKQEHTIKQDEATRAEEAAKVKNAIKFRA